MKNILPVFFVILLLATTSVGAVSQGFNYAGKEYYIVTSTDSTEDTGNEVCEKMGKRCVGYTENSAAVCKYFHSDATETSSMSGDLSGIYCDGPPQTGVCGTESNTCHTCPECTLSVDCSTAIGGLYREMYVECADKPASNPFQDIIAAITAFFSQIFGNIFSLFTGQNQTIVQNISVEVGPYPDMYACEFFQIPWPGVNKKQVSCPYETPGAAINVAADEFCRTSMGSAWAEAALCDESGVIVCTHPCETTPAHIIPQRCAFDGSRLRGNQAPPISWCTPGEPVVPPTGEGRPDNCDDTAYQAHPGYNQNQALWDSYMANTDGVCQSQYGRGVPSPCAHTVQISVGGNPYYICWYNN